MNSQITIESIAADVLEQAKRLAAVAEMEGNGAPQLRDDEVRTIVARCSELVRGAGTLGASRNAVALGVVLRTVIESLILLLWVEVSEENAKHQAGAGLAKFARIAKINIQAKNLRVMSSTSGEDVAEDFLNTPVFKNRQKSKNVVDMAKEAGVLYLYDVLYRFQSMSTHGHSFEKENQGKDIEEKLEADLKAVASIAQAIGHVAVRWLLGRERTDNKTLSEIFGLIEEGK